MRDGPAATVRDTVGARLSYILRARYVAVDNAHSGTRGNGDGSVSHVRGRTNPSASEGRGIRARIAQSMHTPRSTVPTRRRTTRTAHSRTRTTPRATPPTQHKLHVLPGSFASHRTPSDTSHTRRYRISDRTHHTRTPRSSASHTHDVARPASSTHTHTMQHDHEHATPCVRARLLNHATGRPSGRDATPCCAAATRAASQVVVRRRARV